MGIYLAAAWSVIAALGLAGLTLSVQRDGPGRRAEPPHRSLRAAAPGHIRHPGRRHGGRTRPHPGGRCRGPHHGLGHDPAACLRAAGLQAGANRPPRRDAQPALGAVLVQHPQPAAYCVAGRHPTVVLTTAAVEALDPDQLAGVLAHERAHLASHHHRIRAMARIARQVLPFMPLMRDTDTQVTRLVELHADDAALRASGPESLATALVLLATAASPAPGPRGGGHRHRAADSPAAATPRSRWAGDGGTCCAPRLPHSPSPRCCSRWPRPCWPSRWGGSPALS